MFMLIRCATHFFQAISYRINKITNKRMSFEDQNKNETGYRISMGLWNWPVSLNSFRRFYVPRYPTDATDQKKNPLILLNWTHWVALKRDINRFIMSSGVEIISMSKDMRKMINDRYESCRNPYNIRKEKSIGCNQLLLLKRLIDCPSFDRKERFLFKCYWTPFKWIDLHLFEPNAISKRYKVKENCLWASRTI